MGTPQMALAYPAVVVFDLDFTLWPLDVDCTATPFVSSTRGVVSADGKRLAPFPEAPACLATLFDAGVRIAFASRTHDPAAAEALLKLLPLPSQTRAGSSLWDALRGERAMFQAYPSRGARAKATHFAAIASASGAPFSDMLFFDDLIENVRDAEARGTACVHVGSAGLTRGALEVGLARWRGRGPAGGAGATARG